MREDEYGDENELSQNDSNSRTVNNYYQSRNGNGALNKIVLGVAAFLLVAFVGSVAFFGAQVWDLTSSVARLEAQMTIVLSRLPP